MLKDLELIHNLGETVGLTMPLTSLVAELHRKLVAEGLGDRDNSAIVRLYRFHG
jgi:3-hydroxyisobutyrate dehydrogenase-like beta-hydroxyacid dehydrogenase